MKKVSMVLLFALVTIVSFGQNQIVHEHDVMEDKNYYSLKKHLLVSDDGKKGFIVDFYLGYKDNKVIYKGLTVTAAQIGSCHENDQLIVLFDDGTKETFSMWNKFNCSGDVYLDWNGSGINTLNKSVKAIRLSNGRTYDSYTKELTKPEDKQFFMNAISCIQKQDIVKK